MTDPTVPQGNDRLAAAMAEVTRLDPLDLLALYYLIQNAVPTAEFPRLLVVDSTLVCPHCNEAIADDDGYTEGLIAVDMAERWTDGAHVSFEDRDVQWNYENESDFEGFLYKHTCNQPVRLPEGWTER